MKYWKIIVFLMLVVSPKVFSSDNLTVDSNLGFKMPSQPFREAFQNQLFADEWDNKPVVKKKNSTIEKAEQSSGSHGKSRIKAIALSLLFPGAGEYYIGQKRDTAPIKYCP